MQLAAAGSAPAALDITCVPAAGNRNFRTLLFQSFLFRTHAKPEQHVELRVAVRLRFTARVRTERAAVTCTFAARTAR